MPELPEVEVVRRTLEASVVGARLATPLVRETRLREPVSERDLSTLAGRRIERLRRRAKYVLADCEGGRTLVVHLGMSGQLTVAPAGTALALHEHVTLPLDDGRRLRFVDPRRFGLVAVLPTTAIATDRRFARLGVEPLGEQFDGELLARRAHRRRGPVKTFLMDPSVVVGVGNIYASEALFVSGVHPRRSVARVARRRWEALAGAIRSTLAAAIEAGGTSLSDYVDADGRSGAFQGSLAVYGREGEPCRACARPLRRIVQAGRSTYYCPGCQR